MKCALMTYAACLLSVSTGAAQVGVDIALKVEASRYGSMTPHLFGAPPVLGPQIDVAGSNGVQLDGEKLHMRIDAGCAYTSPVIHALRGPINQVVFSVGSRLDSISFLVRFERFELPDGWTEWTPLFSQTEGDDFEVQGPQITVAFETRQFQYRIVARDVPAEVRFVSACWRYCEPQSQMQFVRSMSMLVDIESVDKSVIPMMDLRSLDLLKSASGATATRMMVDAMLLYQGSKMAPFWVTSRPRPKRPLSIGDLDVALGALHDLPSLASAMPPGTAAILLRIDNRQSLKRIIHSRIPVMAMVGPDGSMKPVMMFGFSQEGVNVIEDSEVRLRAWDWVEEWFREGGLAYAMYIPRM